MRVHGLEAIRLCVRGLVLSAAVALGLSAWAVTVEVVEDCVGMGEVVWSQKVQANGTTKLVLKAEAAGGYAFSGWTVEDESGQAWPADPRYAGSLTATVSTNAIVTASFIAEGEDGLSFSLGDIIPAEVACGEEVTCPLEIDSLSFPTLKFSGLPHGLTYDSHTLTLSGKPNEPGVYQIEASGVNASGYSFWSSAEMRVGNISGSRVSGNDEEIPLDAYYHACPEDLFLFDGEVVSVGLSGMPPGLVWDEEWQLLYGTPTEPGDYVITATAEFAAGGSESATLVLSVVAPDPSEYDVSLDSLEFVQVGDVFVAEENEIGTGSDDSGIVDVTGLPKGLSRKKWSEGGVRHWGLSGQLTKTGRYRVWVSVIDDSGVTQRVVRTSRIVTVSDVPKQYLTAVASDDTRGAVSGGGAVTPGLPVTLTAKPFAGQVFAGWYDEFGECQVLDDGTDYRTPSLTLPGETDYVLSYFVAQFVSSDEDEAPEFAGLDEESLVLSKDIQLEHAFSVYSVSLPVLTFKGLPNGFACSSLGTGEYVLSYDAAASASRPAPGRYPVTATAVNASNRKATARFTITVSNLSDSRVRVEDDYGEFDPGEEIDPIDLSGAVDFDCGETLAVSGLPKGLVYNAKANEKKGIEAHTITGTPTAPGDYTLTFTAKVIASAKTNAAGKVTYSYETVKVSSFITILPYPELLLEVDEDAAAAGCKATGGGNYKPGTKVTLKATAAKGWVFAGWDGLDEVDFPQTLNPKLSYTSGSDDVWAIANFITVDADYLHVDDPTGQDDDFAAELELGVPVDEAGVERLICDAISSGSWPTVKVSGLPTGLSFSASTLLLSGTPKKSGVYHVSVSAKNVGGYSFYRMFDIVVLNADGSLPEEKPLANDAEIDFSPWMSLMTGMSCQDEDHVLAVPEHPTSSTSVKKVAVSGLPTGLKAETSLRDDGTAEVSLVGVPTKPGRYVVAVTVSYVSGKSLKSQQAITVTDGGSSYFYVRSDTDGCGVTGEGVYSSGQTVKLTAKAGKGHVFAGWALPDSVAESLGGVDLRTPTISFVCPAVDYSDATEAVGRFVTTDEDRNISVAYSASGWSIQPSEPSEFAFSVESASLPKVTVKGLPKGATMSVADGRFYYTPTTTLSPGIYPVVLSVKNTTVTKAKEFSFEIHVANWTSEAIGGLDPSMDAYPLTAGVTMDPSTIVPLIASSWKISVKGLPAGLSFKDGAVVGAPTKAGDYLVTFTATPKKNPDKISAVATIVIRVASTPTPLVGTFNGFLLDLNDCAVGTLTLSATAAGKISASVKLPSKTYSHSAKAWDAYDGETARLALGELAKGELSLTVDTKSAWPAWQLSGTWQTKTTRYTIIGQRSPYDKTTGDPVAQKEITALVGSSTESGWTAKIAKTGTVTISGKHEGKKISGTSALFCDEDGYFAKIINFKDKHTALSVELRFSENGRIDDIQIDSVIVP